MAKIITLGEIMLRLSAPDKQRFVQAKHFDVVYGGGEANVATSLALFGHESYYVSKVPDNAIGQSAINHLRQFGVHTDHMVKGAGRMGIYYLENGVSMRPSQVIYDRENSAISQPDINDFDFDAIFKDALWFHWSGITPALSDKASAIILMACKVAKDHGVTISVDLNYRKKLWTTKQAQSVMQPLMEYVDVCIGNEEDAKNILGYAHKSSDVTKGKLASEEYETTLKQMIKDYNFKFAVTTLRESLSATHNKWRAIMHDGQKSYHSNTYDITPIVDRIGGGDSFAAGLIYGLISKKSNEEALNFATAASALKHTIPGDQNLVSLNEVETLLAGDASGRVQR